MSVSPLEVHHTESQSGAVSRNGLQSFRQPTKALRIQVDEQNNKTGDPTLMPKIQPKMSEVMLLGDLIKTDIAPELVNLCLKNGFMRHDIRLAIGRHKNSYHYRHKAVYVYTPKRVIGWGYVRSGGLFCVYVTPYWRKRGIGSMIVERLRREMKRHHIYCLPWSEAGVALYRKFKIENRDKIKVKEAPYARF